MTNMIPSPNHPVWSKLVKGEIQHQWKLTSASMLSFSLQQQYKKTPQKLPELIEEARQFFTKYESIFAPDLTNLFR